MSLERALRKPASCPRAVLVLVLTVLVALVAGCGPSPGRIDRAPEIALPFEKYTLANGLEVILRKDERVPVASVNLRYRVGPANEVAGRTGFAHLFEHMMFQGSGHTGADAFFAHLEPVGATGVNASTNFDFTKYVEDVPAEALELALWLESDRMGFLLDRLDQAQLTNQQSVVRNERRQSVESVPYGLTNEATYQLLFPPGHPYHAAIIGSHEDIQAARLPDVREFFSRYYVPNNASLAIVGNIDIAATKALVQKYFGSIPRGADVPEPQVSVPRLTQETRRVIPDRVELPAVTMAWLTPPAFAPGDAEAGVAASVLGSGRTSRLYEELVHRTGIAQDVSAHQEPLRYGSVFSISATAKPGHSADELETAIQRELDKLAADGPTAVELAAVATGIRAGAIFQLEEPSAVANLFNHYDQYLGDPGRLNEDLRRYTDVDAQDVRRFVTEQLPRDRRVVIHTVPGEKVLPADPPVAPTPTSNAESKPAPSAQPWRNVVPQPGPGPALSLPQAQRFELANGLPVYLIESHGLPLTVASLVSRWGSAADPAELPGLAEVTASMLDKGTQTRDGLATAREIERLGASLSTYASNEGSAVDVASLSPQLDPAMAVMADVVLAPAFPEAELERVRGESLVGLRQQRDDAASIASTVLMRELYGAKHPYGYSSDEIEKALATIKRADLLRFHQAAFNPANSALVLAGDLTPEQARTLADKHFGSWRGAGAAPPQPGPPVPSAGRVFVVDKPGAGQTTLELGQPGIGYTNPDAAKLMVMNAVLGGGFTSRVNLNLRERHGYAYGASSSMSSTRDGGLITLQTSVDARFTGASIRELLGEVAALQNAPVSAEELTLAKGSLIRSLPAQFATGGAAAGAVRGLYLDDLPPDYYQKLSADIAKVDVPDVQAMAAKYLRPREMKVIAVGDRAQIDAQLAGLSTAGSSPGGSSAAGSPLGPIAYRDAAGAPATG